jgi:hypothetical protein
MEIVYRPNDLHSEYLSPNGALWVPYDARSDECPLNCENCQAETYDGWLCLDGSETLCCDCVRVVPAFIGDRLAAEYAETIAAHNAMVGMRTLVGAAFLDCFRAQHAPNKYLGWVVPADAHRINSVTTMRVDGTTYHHPPRD